MIALDTELYYFLILAVLYPGYIVVSFVRGLHKHTPPLGMVYNKNQTDFLKGICAVAIMLHHFTGKIEHHNFSAVYSVYMNAGYLAVAIFLMISGYCLMLQLERKGCEYLNHFLHRRILRLYIPWVVCTAFVGLLRLDNPLIILKNILTFNFTIESSGMPNATWFPIAITVFSIGFFCAAKWKNGRFIIAGVFLCAAIWSVWCMIIGVGTWWYNTAIAFPMGVCLCKYRERLYQRVYKHYGLVVIGLIAIFGGTYLIMAAWKSQVILQIICSSALALLTWVICLQVNLDGTIGRQIGKFSFELFLVHSAILKSFYGLGITNAGWTILLVLLACVFSGWVMHQISVAIIQKLLRR